MTALLEDAADSQDYHPEWVIWEPWTEQSTAPADQEEHALKISSIGPDVANSQTEAYKICVLARCNPTDLANLEKLEIGAADDVLYNLMFEFNAIQMAGPDLTPQTYYRGYQSLPCATGPLYGTFCYSASTVNAVGAPPDSFVISGWNNSATNPANGSQGNWVECNGGTRYMFPPGYGPIANLGSGQLRCPYP